MHERDACRTINSWCSAGLTEERVESFVKDGHVQEETIEIRTLTTITAEIVPPTVRK